MVLISHNVLIWGCGKRSGLAVQYVVGVAASAKDANTYSPNTITPDCPPGAPIDLTSFTAQAR
jgi:hypothetical protein